MKIEIIVIVLVVKRRASAAAAQAHAGPAQAAAAQAHAGQAPTRPIADAAPRLGVLMMMATWMAR